MRSCRGKSFKEWNVTIYMKPVACLVLALLSLSAAGCGGAEAAADARPSPAKAGAPAAEVELLNSSYDPTRELWRDLNERFIAAYQNRSGAKVTIKQSHGGSSSQARAVVDGLEADVVTLAIWSDIDAIRKAGLIANDWQKRLPHDSLAYFSTIVFVVRKANPHAIKDWSDLVRSGVEVITPSPKTPATASSVSWPPEARSWRAEARSTTRWSSSGNSTGMLRCWIRPPAPPQPRSPKKASATCI
jgi:ABC-type sulfate transport system substrate-binding protein